jgi:hypothetical protein
MPAEMGMGQASKVVVVVVVLVLLVETQPDLHQEMAVQVELVHLISRTLHQQLLQA